VEAVTRHLYEVDGWGIGEIWVAGTRLVHHVLAGQDVSLETGIAARPTAPSPAPPTSPRGPARAPGITLPAHPSPESARFVTDLCARFSRHLHGIRVDYRDVDVEPGEPTPFERDLAHVLRGVPWGEVVTYGELAALAGRPGAARAAGSFCASGCASLVLPYHRVVAATGVGGYGDEGIATKRRLLALEGVAL
jgi:O-6-methylguanine DNA methyltransferase